MFLDNDVSTTNNNQKDLLGLRMSAVLLVLLECLFGLYVLLSGLVLCISVIRYLHGHLPASEIPLWFLSLCATSALTYLCFRAAAGLRDAQRWAAYVAVGFGLLLLLFSGSCIYDWFHPERQIPDEAFGILIIPILVAVGSWWCIYLNLPHVRTNLKKIPKH